MHQLRLKVWTEDATTITYRLATLLQAPSLNDAINALGLDATAEEPVEIIIEHDHVTVHVTRRTDADADVEVFIGVPTDGYGDETVDELADNVSEAVQNAATDAAEMYDWIGEIGGVEMPEEPTRNRFDDQRGAVVLYSALELNP